jgi:glycosyltransferase involved in cell wall biosynthesis
LIVVGSKRVEKIVKNKYADKRVELVYPFVELSQSFSKQQAKQDFCDIHGLRSETKIISFYDMDFKNGGVKEFISMVNNLNYKFVKACIIGDTKSIDTVRLFIARLQTKHRFLLIEEEKLDDVLKASDVFISPTQKKTFHMGVLKAMAYENVVFISIDNDVSELLDNYSVMHAHNDMTVLFKVERILQSESDLKLIGEQNAQIVKNLASANLEEKLKF